MFCCEDCRVEASQWSLPWTLLLQVSSFLHFLFEPIWIWAVLSPYVKPKVEESRWEQQERRLCCWWCLLIIFLCIWIIFPIPRSSRAKKSEHLCSENVSEDSESSVKAASVFLFGHYSLLLIQRDSFIDSLAFISEHSAACWHHLRGIYSVRSADGVLSH